jgi:hypothetical protein
MAAETSADAYLPVTIVLFKLHLEFLWEKLSSIFSSSTSPPPPPSPSTTTTNEEHSPIDFNSSWDLYLMAALLGLIGALYTMRRQRVALQQQRQQQPPVQAPVQ